MNAYGEKQLVNSQPNWQSAENVAQKHFYLTYELMHEGQIQILKDAPDKTLQKVNDAKERLIFWQKRMEKNPVEQGNVRLGLLKKVSALFATPIPFWETIRLWKYANLPKHYSMLWQNLRGFLMRMVIVIIPLLSLYTYSFSDTFQIYRITSHNPWLSEITPASINRMFENEKNTIRMIAGWLKQLTLIGNGQASINIAQKLDGMDARASAYSAISKSISKRK